MKNILITGGCGYVGSKASKKFLKSGFKVFSIDNLLNSNQNVVNLLEKNNNFINFPVDIRDTKKVKDIVTQNKINTLIHLAAIVGDPACKKNEKDAIEINLNASINLFKISVERNIENFIFSSTCSNYGLIDNNNYASEDTILNPLSIYAKTKVDFEKYIINNVNHSNMKAAILRFATVFGLSDRMRFDLTVNQFVKDIFLKKKIDIFYKDTWRPYCHVADIASCLELIIYVSNKLSIYNVGDTEKNYTKKNIVDEIGKYISLLNVNYINKNDEKDLRNYKVSFKKITKEINFKTEYNLKDGIEEILLFLKKNINENFDNKKYSNT